LFLEKHFEKVFKDLKEPNVQNTKADNLSFDLQFLAGSYDIDRVEEKFLRKRHLFVLGKGLI
jgi:hypothetical protein